MSQIKPQGLRAYFNLSRSNFMGRRLEDALATWTNLRGWSSAEKLVVVESDDWGAIRMPGKRALEALTGRGLGIDDSRFDHLDSLESGEDLRLLFELLEKHVDSEGCPAVMTLNVVMGNPDFEAIRRDGFERFHHESFFDSYRRYCGEELEDLWKCAVTDGLIRPQFHAREHLNSILWMRDLKDGREPTRLAFDYGFYGLAGCTSSSVQNSYLAAYWAENRVELEEMKMILADGLNQFASAFGFRSRSFIGCNYVWPMELEPFLADQGIMLLQGQRGQLQPRLNEHGRAAIQRRYTGQKNQFGQRYSVRNVRFEPFEDEVKDWVGIALKQIQQSFLFNRPAVVSTHRINYTSGMSARHRDRNLSLLNELLLRIRSLWPEVQFISSDRLCERMQAAR